MFNAVYALENNWSPIFMCFMNIFVLHDVFQSPLSVAALQGLVPVHQTMGQLEMLLKMRLRFCHRLLILR